tara:strand:- start:542 stop:1030 length:489 start_codon:yes stop_codon:yes gene_type:complete
MKNIYLTLFALCLSFSLSLQAQFRTVSSGGDVSNNSGSVSFTLGLIDYMSVDNNSGSISQGVQIPSLFSSDVNNLDGVDPIMLNKKLIVFPNPATDFIFIRSTGFTQQLKYQLYNLMGSILDEGLILQDETRLAIYPYAVGSYFLSIQNNDGEIKRFKVIKE